MRVGYQMFMSNYTSWSGAVTDVPALSDAAVYESEMRLVELADEIGFDTVWCVEHHLTPYSMGGSPSHLLMYFAGRLRNVDLGCDVIVLPWHDPLEVAESLAIIDNLLGGRKLFIGFGRGNSPREFGPLRVDYQTSRERMMESLDIIRLGLTQESFSYDGEVFKIPEVSIRPRPRTPDLTQNMMMVFVSPETRQAAAESGCAPLITNFSGWGKLERDMEEFRRVRQEKGWKNSSAPVSVTIFVDEDGDRARELGTKHWRQSVELAVWHYDQTGNPEFLPGVDAAEKKRILDAAYEKQVAGGFFGTPDEVAEALIARQSAVDVSEYICLFSYGDMDAAEAERNMRLFADKVMPRLKAIPCEDVRATSWNEMSAERSGRGLQDA